jgi:tRNA 2-thiouridine synthesizing protein B
MLHTVNKSPYQFRSIQTCLRVAAEEDPILLYEDGVYAAMPGTMVTPLMERALKTHPIYAIRADLKARGVERILEGIRVCDYSCFVALVEEHKVFSWL